MRTQGAEQKAVKDYFQVPKPNQGTQAKKLSWPNFRTVLDQ